MFCSSKLFLLAGGRIIATRTYVIVEFHCRKTLDKVVVPVRDSNWKQCMSSNTKVQNMVIARYVVPEMRAKNPLFPGAVWRDFDYKKLREEQRSSNKRAKKAAVMKVPPSTEAAARHTGHKLNPKEEPANADAADQLAAKSAKRACKVSRRLRPSKDQRPML